MPPINQRTVVKGGRVGTTSGGLTANQKLVIGLLAVFVGPAALKKFYDKPAEEKVDLSAFNIVTKYDTPAIQKMDNTFKRAASVLQQNFPHLKIEGGPYTPPPSVQYGIRAIRVAQVGTAAVFFLGEAIFGYFGRPPPHVVGQMHENKFVTAAAVYGLDVVAQTMKSINAFEITYNGHVLHSKLKTGQFPSPQELAARLQAVVASEARDSGPAAEAAAAA